MHGVRHLIDLARAGPYAGNVKFLFTSSVAQALSWDKSQGDYPETILPDAKYAVAIGYGESKYVAERVRLLPRYRNSAELMFTSTKGPFSERLEGDLLPNRADYRREAKRRLGNQ